MHPYVYCSFICNNQDLEAVQVSISRWAMAHLHKAIYSAIKKKRKRKSYPLLQHGWSWRTLCSVKQASQRKTHTIGFHSHVASNEQNELTGKIMTHSHVESRLTAVGEVLGGWRDWEKQEIKRNYSWAGTTEVIARSGGSGGRGRRVKGG